MSGKRRYRIRTGDLDWTGNALSAQSAFAIAAQEKEHFRTIGVLVQADLDGIEDSETTVYFNPLPILRSLGLLKEDDL